MSPQCHSSNLGRDGVFFLPGEDGLCDGGPPFLSFSRTLGGACPDLGFFFFAPPTNPSDLKPGDANPPGSFFPLGVAGRLPFENPTEPLPEPFVAFGPLGGFGGLRRGCLIIISALGSPVYPLGNLAADVRRLTFLAIEFSSLFFPHMLTVSFILTFAVRLVWYYFMGTLRTLIFSHQSLGSFLIPILRLPSLGW